MKKLNRRILDAANLILVLDLILMILVIFIRIPAGGNIERVREPIPKEIVDTLDPASFPVSIHQEDVGVSYIAPEPDLSSDLYDISELVLAAKVVHAEAGNQDVQGRRLVAAVILNRVDSIYFPDTIGEVVTQENQFARGVDYTSEDLAAVRAEVEERSDPDIFYFRRNTYHAWGRPAYKHGDHYFNYL